jgi:AcrR family transcriptional regulator
MSTSRVALPDRGRYHHGDLRNALVEAGRAVARDVGEEALTLREVARRAGVSHTATYNHFSSKLELLREIAMRAFAEFTERLDEASTADGREALEHMGAAYVRFALDHAVEFGFMFNRELCRPPGEPDELKDTSIRSQEVLRRTLASLQAAGHIRADDLEQQVLAVWSQIHGLTTIVLEAPGFAGMPVEVAEDLARSGIRRMLDGLSP